jgi:effector-binding domain-containing protein
MAFELRTEHVEARPLASIRTTATRQDLTATIFRQLDVVWPLLREQGVRFGHNVVVYHPGDATSLPIEVGVEAFTDFTARDGVERTYTPAGEVVAAAYYGDYGEMAPAYAALEEWCASNRRRATGVSWEVYGDWEDDPTKRRTDIYVLLEPVSASI